MTLREFDEALLERFQLKIVWPFEFGNHGTRCTILRVANLFSGILFLAATLTSPYLTDSFYKAFYMGLGMGMIFFLDSWLKQAEATALRAGRRPNIYSEKFSFRMCWVAASFVFFLIGVVALTESSVEGLCRMVMSIIGIFAIYVFSADPVPENWHPRVKHLNW